MPVVFSMEYPETPVRVFPDGYSKSVGITKDSEGFYVELADVQDLIEAIQKAAAIVTAREEASNG